MRVLWLVLIGLLWWTPVEATTITAANCSDAAVTTALGSAVTGDIVVIPGGTCLWTTLHTVGSKSITIQGAAAGTVAQCAVGGQTSKTCITQDSTNTSGLLQWTLISTGVPKITGMTFDGGASGASCSGTVGILNITGDSASWTFTANRVVARRCNGMVINGYVRGVDTSTHENLGANVFSVFLHHGGWAGGASTCPSYSGGCGDRSWAAATNFGSSGFYIFEDCTFERTSTSAPQYMTDGWKGQRMVVRFCNIVDGSINDHGTDSSGRVRGARAKEVYANAYSLVTLNTSAVMSARGGTALFWGNEATVSGSGGLTRMADATHYRVTAFNPPECSYWGCADDPVNNNFDQGAGTSNGYAAMDQVGRGIGDLITGDEFVSPCTGVAKCGVTPATWPHQALEPVYGWDLNINGTNSPVSAAGAVAYVVENREFYTEGSLNGVKGSGLRSARSATCTTGQAYWSTDGGGNWNTSTSNSKGVQRNGADGALDKCTATNTWTNDWYIPYTYPHPLVGGSSPPPPDTTPPAAPIGITIVKVSR